MIFVLPAPMARTSLPRELVALMPSTASRPQTYVIHRYASDRLQAAVATSVSWSRPYRGIRSATRSRVPRHLRSPTHPGEPVESTERFMDAQRLTGSWACARCMTSRICGRASLAPRWLMRSSNSSTRASTAWPQRCARSTSRRSSTGGLLYNDLHAHLRGQRAAARAGLRRLSVCRAQVDMLTRWRRRSRARSRSTRCAGGRASLGAFNITNPPMRP